MIADPDRMIKLEVLATATAPATENASLMPAYQ